MPAAPPAALPPAPSRLRLRARPPLPHSVDYTDHRPLPLPLDPRSLDQISAARQPLPIVPAAPRVRTAGAALNRVCREADGGLPTPPADQQQLKCPRRRSQRRRRPKQRPMRRSKVRGSFSAGRERRPGRGHGARSRGGAARRGAVQHAVLTAPGPSRLQQNQQPASLPPRPAPPPRQALRRGGRRLHAGDRGAARSRDLLGQPVGGAHKAGGVWLRHRRRVAGDRGRPRLHQGGACWFSGLV